MKRRRTKFALLFAATLWIGGAFVWPGCISMPLPSSHTPVDHRHKGDFTHARLSAMTMAEIVARLGDPDAYLPDERVACYKIDTINRRSVFLLLFVIPVSVDQYPDRQALGFVQFDDQDRVKRTGVVTCPVRADKSAETKKWLTSQDSPPPGN